MVNIFEYTDYRDYLRDQFAECKRTDPKFSHRYLARQLDLAGTNFILLVIQGKRNLTQSIAFRLSQFFKHSKQEAEYFSNMMGLLHAKSSDEKNARFIAMVQARKDLKIDRIDASQYEYYTNWYNPVVRELVTRDTFNGDFAAMARVLQPPITASQAKQSVELLMRLGMIEREGSRFVQMNPVITTGPEVHSLAVMNFHKTMARFASESYDRHLRSERTITSCTICMSRFAFEALKNEIADLRKKALLLAETQNDDVRVYQMNIQVFPLTKSVKGSEAHDKA